MAAKNIPIVPHNRSARIPVGPRPDHLPTIRDWTPDNIPQNSKEINWLGGSYSGTDIIVVAHLYDEMEGDVNNDLREEKDDLLYHIVTFERFLTNSNFGSVSYPRRPDFLRAGSNEFKTDNIELSAGFKGAHEDLANYWSIYQSNPSQAIILMKTDIVNMKDMVESKTEYLAKQDWIKKNSSTTLVLSSLQTISIQSHREKFAVRALGTNYAKGYTRGPRTIAGSMIFTIFEEHPLKKLIRAIASSSRGDASRFRRYGEMDDEVSLAIPDMLPPIDLTIVFANEYGNLSKKSIYGVEFINDGVTFSIEDMLSEQVLNFVARDVDIMTSLGTAADSKVEASMYQNHGKFSSDQRASDLLFTSQDSYDRYIARLGIKRRLKNR